jgi:YEATS domain-containing protein 4
MAALPPSPASSLQIPSGSTTSAGSSGGATASSKRKRRLHDLSTDEINEIVALRGKLSQAVVGKKYGIEQTEVSAIQRMQRVKIARLVDENEKKPMVGRVKGVDVTIPIVYGSIAFWLGKKAAESTHKWTTYVRSANNEDLSVLIKKVVFQLHPSFEKPTRTVEAAPFELSESGWGEFEIGITIYFHSDVGEKPLELFHHLKLYADDESIPQTTKKPVVVEAYDEIVLSEPMEASFGRLRNHPVARVSGSPTSPLVHPVGESSFERKGGDTKDHPLAQWFMKHSETEDMSFLQCARQQVWGAITKLKKDIGAMENEMLRIKATTR